MISPRKRVIVGMSGGIDSSVAAYLLKEEGYAPVGITLSLWEGGSRCCSDEDAADARRVCRMLGIPHYTVCHTSRFKREVVDYFVGEYARGRTPNPCVVCNERIKFRMLLTKAMETGAHHIATGHYARVDYEPDSGAYVLKKGVDASKDQSYFLATLPQRLLARILFPLGSFTKERVRELARSACLPVSDKDESQEVCFVREGEQESFLEERIGRHEGEILDELGHVLGLHTGVYRFTVGQRRGLRISKGAPLYVTSIEAQANRILVGPEDSLFKRTVLLEDVRLLAPGSSRRISVTAKIRYAAPLEPASFERVGETGAEVVFERPQRAVAPGQLLVAYTGDTAYASGWIASSR